MAANFKSSGPVTLSEEQISVLLQKLSTMRHDVTGRLANITAAAELMRLRPERSAELLRVLLEQPHHAADGVAQFSREFESTFGVVRQ